MKRIIYVLLLLLAIVPMQNVFAEDDITIEYNGEPISFTEKNIVMNNRTLVQLRPIAETLQLGIEYDLSSGSVILSNADAVVEFKQNSDVVIVDDEDIKMDVPLIVHNNYSFVPVRYLVEPFGYDAIYCGESQTVTIAKKSQDAEVDHTVPEQSEIENAEKNVREMPFYYQADLEFGFENNGRGYCWVCSYAMLFSANSNEDVTPVEIANYNIENGFEGNFMGPHELLAYEFGLRLVPALSEDSPYFAGFDLNNRCETALKVETDEDAVAAISEALEKFPAGVIVRYEGYPHSMIALEVKGDVVYFNDPAKKDGERIPFEETCLKNFNLSDISFIQAVE